jgi:hypothetical protein
MNFNPDLSLCLPGKWQQGDGNRNKMKVGYDSIGLGWKKGFKGILME